MKRVFGPCRRLSVVVLLSALAGLGILPRGPADGAPGPGHTLVIPPTRNRANTVDKDIPAEWDIKDGTNVKWTAQLGKVSYGSSVVAGGKVFVGTNNENPRDPEIKGDKGVLMCFRESDGKFLWQAVHDKLGSEANDFPHQGIASSPAVDGNRLYYVSNRCELVCADTEGDGKGHARFIWVLDMIKDLGVFPRELAVCSPLIVDDLVFAVTGNGIAEDEDSHGYKVVAPRAPSFIAVNKHTGKVVWQDSSPGDRIMEAQWSNPTYAEANGKPQVIFPGGDGWLYAFEPTTGKLIWKFDCNPKDSVYKPGGTGATRNFIMATPVVYDNKCYVGVGINPDHGAGVGHFWCLDITKEPANADKDLSPVGDNFDPAAPVNKNSGLVWHYGGFVVPKPERGRQVLFGRTLSTVAIHEGLVFAPELDGYVHCFDARNGTKYWTFDMKASVWGSPYYVDGKVFIGNDDGDFYAFAADKTLKQVAKNDMEQAVKTMPVVADGVLYVMTDTQLYAIAKK